MATELKSGGNQSLPLDEMPTEILDAIASYLPQEDLLSLMRTSRAMKESATIFLYNAPMFASPWRFAQFVYLISHNPDLALMVRSLDLSNICSDPRDVPDEEGLYHPLAGWVEFALRNSDLYPIVRKPAPAGTLPRLPQRLNNNTRYGIPQEVIDRRIKEEMRVEEQMQKAKQRQNPLVNFETLRSLEQTRPKSSHPPPSQWHTNYHRNRNVPIGGLCHIFAACRKLKKINLSGLSIVTDELILSKEIPKKHPRFVMGQFMTRFPTSHNPISPPFTTGMPGNASSHPWFVPDEPPIYDLESSEPPPQVLKDVPSICPSPLHVFTSDMQHDRWCEKPAQTTFIHGDEVIHWLCTLPELEVLEMRGVEWFAACRVRKLVRDLVRPEDGKGAGIKFLDFRNTGFGKYEQERRKDMFGTREDVERMVDEARAAGRKF